MDGTLAELYGALLKQPQGILAEPATANPLMMAKALRQQQAIPRPSLQEVLGNYPQTWQQFGDNLQANYPTDSPATVRQAAFEAAKNAGPLMTVWQGSPHRFAPTKNNPLGEFDATKIGSGEGAQAYGYGHYLAENPAVAKSYKASGGSMTQNPDLYAADLVAMYGSKDKALAQLKHVLPAQGQTTFSGQSRELIDGAIRSIESGAYAKNAGNLYKVDLPDEHIAKMLDWDKPLSQQPESVRKAIEPVVNQHIRNAFIDGVNGNTLESAKHWNPWLRTWVDNPSQVTGEDVYRILKSGAYPGHAGTQEAASKLIKQSGIPGIRYLDGGSRAGGQGTSNFVVFPGNEGILKILARE